MLPREGEINLEQIAKEFGYTTTPLELSQLYAGGTYVPSNTLRSATAAQAALDGLAEGAPVPTSGSISMANFYGITMPLDLTYLFPTDRFHVSSVNQGEDNGIRYTWEILGGAPWGVTGDVIRKMVEKRVNTDSGAWSIESQYTYPVENLLGDTVSIKITALNDDGVASSEPLGTFEQGRWMNLADGPITLEQHAHRHGDSMYVLFRMEIRQNSLGSANDHTRDCSITNTVVGGSGGQQEQGFPFSRQVVRTTPGDATNGIVFRRTSSNRIIARYEKNGEDTPNFSLISSGGVEYQVSWRLVSGDAPEIIGSWPENAYLTPSEDVDFGLLWRARQLETKEAVVAFKYRQAGNSVEYYEEVTFKTVSANGDAIPFNTAPSGTYTGTVAVDGGTYNVLYLRDNDGVQEFTDNIQLWPNWSKIGEFGLGNLEYKVMNTSGVTITDWTAIPANNFVALNEIATSMAGYEETETSSFQIQFRQANYTVNTAGPYNVTLGVTNSFIDYPRDLTVAALGDHEYIEDDWSDSTGPDIVAGMALYIDAANTTLEATFWDSKGYESARTVITDEGARASQGLQFRLIGSGNLNFIENMVNNGGWQDLPAGSTIRFGVSIPKDTYEGNSRDETFTLWVRDKRTLTSVSKEIYLKVEQSVPKVVWFQNVENTNNWNNISAYTAMGYSPVSILGLTDLGYTGQLGTLSGGRPVTLAGVVFGVNPFDYSYIRTMGGHGDDTEYMIDQPNPTSAPACTSFIGQGEYQFKIEEFSATTAPSGYSYETNASLGTWYDFPQTNELGGGKVAPNSIYYCVSGEGGSSPASHSKYITISIRDKNRPDNVVSRTIGLFCYTALSHMKDGVETSYNTKPMIMERYLSSTAGATVTNRLYHSSSGEGVRYQTDGSTYAELTDPSDVAYNDTLVSMIAFGPLAAPDGTSFINPNVSYNFFGNQQLDIVQGKVYRIAKANQQYLFQDEIRSITDVIPAGSSSWGAEGGAYLFNGNSNCAWLGSRVIPFYYSGDRRGAPSAPTVETVEDIGWLSQTNWVINTGTGWYREATITAVTNGDNYDLMLTWDTITDLGGGNLTESYKLATVPKKGFASVTISMDGNNAWTFSSDGAKAQISDSMSHKIRLTCAYANSVPVTTTGYQGANLRITVSNTAGSATLLHFVGLRYNPRHKVSVPVSDLSFSNVNALPTNKNVRVWGEITLNQQFDEGKMYVEVGSGITSKSYVWRVYHANQVMFELPSASKAWWNNLQMQVSKHREDAPSNSVVISQDGVSNYTILSDDGYLFYTNAPDDGSFNNFQYWFGTSYPKTGNWWQMPFYVKSQAGQDDMTKYDNKTIQFFVETNTQAGASYQYHEGEWRFKFRLYTNQLEVHNITSLQRMMRA
ncbi:hypothetical protein [Vibrio phage YC]|uniref:Uncharacterized protein n=1 Tax=Vibrio phage YC TaxID=2267403 RepID=A0A384ZS97_9CAUD|nr:hypothetical protein HWB64_gp162 [Vibrio phage YC]AXC34531.1 hypothetical protein [Vibrio phage YC]